MEAASLALRTVLIYVVMYLIIRLMGKREIGKLSVFDLVISIMIAEIAAIMIEDRERPLWEGLLPMGVLAATQILLALISLKSRTLRVLFDGKPSYLIENGKLNIKEMKKQRYTLDDLMLQLRENKVMNVADVEFALLESTGKLTVTTKEEFNKAKQTDSQTMGEKVNVRYEGLPIPLVMDGKVQEENLQKIGQNRFWLHRELQKRGVKSVKDVFLCTLDHRGRLYIDRK